MGCINIDHKPTVLEPNNRWTKRPKYGLESTGSPFVILSTSNLYFAPGLASLSPAKKCGNFAYDSLKSKYIAAMTFCLPSHTLYVNHNDYVRDEYKLLMLKKTNQDF